jgi:excisionase family DNA binding protein
VTASTETPRIAWTAQELAASLGVSAKHVYRMCAAGEIEHRRLGHRVFIPVDVVRRLVGDEAFDLATRLAARKPA